MATYVSLSRVKLTDSLCRWLGGYIVNGKEKIRKICGGGYVQRREYINTYNFFYSFTVFRKRFLRTLLGAGGNGG